MSHPGTEVNQTVRLLQAKLLDQIENVSRRCRLVEHHLLCQLRQLHLWHVKAQQAAHNL
ncbi:MAG: hypothetical protein JF584_19835, partial [Acidobacteria bacterium]|nr:hypothetical protein [Acidobacteriota bacterium]